MSSSSASSASLAASWRRRVLCVSSAALAAQWGPVLQGATLWALTQPSGRCAVPDCTTPNLRGILELDDAGEPGTLLSVIGPALWPLTCGHVVCSQCFPRHVYVEDGHLLAVCPRAECRHSQHLPTAVPALGVADPVARPQPATQSSPLKRKADESGALEAVAQLSTHLSASLSLHGQDGARRVEDPDVVDVTDASAPAPDGPPIKRTRTSQRTRAQPAPVPTKPSHVRRVQHVSSLVSPSPAPTPVAGSAGDLADPWVAPPAPHVHEQLLPSADGSWHPPVQAPEPGFASDAMTDEELERWMQSGQFA